MPVWMGFHPVKNVPLLLFVLVLSNTCFYSGPFSVFMFLFPLSNLILCNCFLKKEGLFFKLICDSFHPCVCFKKKSSCTFVKVPHSHPL